MEASSGQNLNKLFIDKRAEQTFRKFKEGDHVVLLYGIGNNVMGTWIGQDNREEFLLTLPAGVKVNGILQVYNENVYEDFDSVMNTEIEKLKNDPYQSVISERIYCLVMKDVLYLDDFDSITFEKTVRVDQEGENDVEVEFLELITKLNQEYFYLQTTFNISNQNEADLKISAEGDIDNVFSTGKDKFIQNYYLFINQDKILIDNLESVNLDFITSLIGTLSISDASKSLTTLENKVNFTLGIKTKEGNMQNLNKIYLPMESGVLDFGLFINKTSSISSQSDIFKLLIDSLKWVLSYFSKNSKNNTSLNRICRSNKIFYPFPLFSIISPHEKILNNKTILNNLNIFTTNFIHLKDLSSPFTRLVNVHNKITRSLPQYSKRFLIKGDVEYFHYGQDSENDKGWGCAYRSLQTLFSWFLINGFAKEGVNTPSINQIQKTLVKIGDKEPSFLGSTDWIGAFEVNIVLNELLGIDSQIIFVASGADLSSKGRELAFHFETNGTPVMIGGGVYAYTILGVEYDRVKGESLFLILDPHYQGEDDVKTIINKGWCEWKTASLFEKESFYNMCLPQIPK